MNISKELSLLGLAAKAGRVVSGEFATEKAVKAGKARLVLVAGDASDNSRKKFSDMCVPTIRCRFILSEQRRSWEVPLERTTARPWA